LLRQARALTAHLKAETEAIQADMEKVFEDDGDPRLDGEEIARAGLLKVREVVPKKSFWRRWR
jgi:hypothetical protein